jgi:N utilization substance protein A
MSQDLLRIVDSICRDKNIERESFINDLEQAMVSAIRKQYDETADAAVKIDPINGDISASVNGTPISMQVMGRIAAQTAKQVIIQKTRERERASIFEDFTERRGTIVTGMVTRVEGGNLLANIGRTEGFLPRSEQIPGETHQVGSRIRVLILEVREQPNQVKIILSRSHPEFILRLFELEVPEVAERIIEIKALAREAGYRTKVAVSSIDSKVDAVGACVGVRGSRIKNIVEELGGEKIDIVRFNESSQILIQNALKPAEVQEIALNFELGKATVVVAEDQLSLAIGKRGQNVRLAARLTGWDIDILTPAEYNKHLETLEACLKTIEGVDDMLIDRLVAFGCISVSDIDIIGPDPLVKELELSAELAEKIVEVAGEAAVRLEEEKEAAEKLKKQQEAEAAAAAAAAAAAGIWAEAVEVSGEAAPPLTESAPGGAPVSAFEAEAPSDVAVGAEGSAADQAPSGATLGAAEGAAAQAAENSASPDVDAPDTPGVNSEANATEPGSETGEQFEESGAASDSGALGTERHD